MTKGEKKVMNIGLYGIGGVYNYGCEAIVRGTVKILKLIDPKCHIIYYSRRANEDRKQLKDINIDIYQISHQLSIFSRAINKLLRIANINYRLLADDIGRMCNECDVLISIGGDIYTIPEYIRKQDIYPYYNKIVQFGDDIIRNGKKLIIFGASVGPFGNYKRANTYYFNHLRKVDLIISREEISLEYLKKNKVKENVCFLPDPAFFVNDDNCDTYKDTDNMEYIGINLSPLSLREMYGGVTLEHKKRLAMLINEISRKTNLKIMLIPHVISPLNTMDNDLIFLSEIAQMIDDDIKCNIKVIDDAGGFIQIKKYLRQCKIVIAARMHCAINAMCESVPTILLSYSEKAKGMAKFVYGSYEWVLSMDNIEDELINKIELMIQKRDDIHDYLYKRINEIRNIEQFEDGLNRLSEIIN